jgi:hypothetical protein
MSVMGFLAVFAGMCCALQWQWFAGRTATLRSEARVEFDRLGPEGASMLDR